MGGHARARPSQRPRKAYNSTSRYRPRGPSRPARRTSWRAAAGAAICDGRPRRHNRRRRRKRRRCRHSAHHRLRLRRSRDPPRLPPPAAALPAAAASGPATAAAAAAATVSAVATTDTAAAPTAALRKIHGGDLSCRRKTRRHRKGDGVGVRVGVRVFSHCWHRWVLLVWEAGRAGRCGCGGCGSYGGCGEDRAWEESRWLWYVRVGTKTWGTERPGIFVKRSQCKEFSNKASPIFQGGLLVYVVFSCHRPCHKNSVENK